jgi:hypothetical protein
MYKKLPARRRKLCELLRRWLRKPQTWMLMAAVVRFVAAAFGLFDRRG